MFLMLSVSNESYYNLPWNQLKLTGITKKINLSYRKRPDNNLELW